MHVTLETSQKNSHRPQDRRKRSCQLGDGKGLVGQVAASGPAQGRVRTMPRRTTAPSRSFSFIKVAPAELPWCSYGARLPHTRD